MFAYIFLLVHVANGYIDHTQYVTSPDTRERNKATHRGNRFVIEYNQTHPRYYFSTQAFEGGSQLDANFAADFEHPEPGTYGWTSDASRIDGSLIRGAHYNTFDYPLSGNLSHIETGSTVHFNTAGASPTVLIDGVLFANGIHSTPGTGLGGVDVAVFNFLFIGKTYKQ